MSNIIDKTENENINQAVQDAPIGKPQVKPTIPNPNPTQQEQVTGASLSPEALKQIAQMIENAKKKTPAGVQKKEDVVLDFAKLTQDDIFNLDIPIEAKPVMSADILKVELKDKNYEARWVNKNPQNLGDKLAKGFTYVEESDLLAPLALETGVDAEGHYSYHDVVCMKIPKSKYYAWLKAAHLRAVQTTKATTTVDAGKQQAAQFMRESDGGISYGSQFADAAQRRYIEFYGNASND